MALDLTRRFLGPFSLGLFGAGHLGRAIAETLLEAGFPKDKMAVCHRGSERTRRGLAESGLVELTASQEDVTGRARILLYLVRPQDRLAIRDWELHEDCLFVSFLAGVPLSNLPANVGETQRVRVMTSAPDTLRRHNGIAALYPAGNPIVREILESMLLRIVPLGKESDIHAFTALGPCLPIALTFWESLGNATIDSELIETADRFGLPGYPPILEWAHGIRPRRLRGEELKRYLQQAATPGGVTDAILTAMDAGRGLAESLIRGIDRSRELAEA